MNDTMWCRLALLTALVRQAPEQTLGRTALMKLLFLDAHQPDIDWAIGTFAPLSATDLELLSTIVYVDRKHRVSSLDEIVSTVHDIKPRFTSATIRRETERLQETGVVACSARCPGMEP